MNVEAKRSLGYTVDVRIFPALSVEKLNSVHSLRLFKFRIRWHGSIIPCLRLIPSSPFVPNCVIVKHLHKHPAKLYVDSVETGDVSFSQYQIKGTDREYKGKYSPTQKPEWDENSLHGLH